MSWLSKISGSDAKKRNTRTLQDVLRGGQRDAAAGMDPSAAFAGTGDAINRWSRTNNRVNQQTGLKGAGLVAGGAMLAGAGGGAGAATGTGAKSGGLLSKITGAASKLTGGGGMGGTLADLGQLGLAGVSMYQGNQDLNKARGLDERMLALAEQEWQSGAPLRDRARALAMAEPLARPGRDPNNPFAR